MRIRELNLHCLASVDIVFVSLRKTNGERATIVVRVSMNARLALDVDTSFSQCFPVHNGSAAYLETVWGPTWI